MRIEFERVKFKGIKNTVCIKCLCRLRRQKTFEQTINPFNRLPNGAIKTREDIYKELWSERTSWRFKSELCEKCKQKEKENP